MRKYLSVLIVLLAFLGACSKQEVHQEASNHEEEYLKKINWRTEWTDKIFADAKASGRPILLSLEARWCHWCHVMKGETYTDDEVAKLLNDNYIAVRVDQDANAYLSNRYKRYGWPATIIFNSSGQELVKRAGYIEADSMENLLTNVLEDPSPERDFNKEIKYSAQGSLDEKSKNKLVESFYKTIDLQKGGLKIVQKYIDRDSIEYAFLVSERGSEGEKAKALKSIKLTLENATKLLDPEWGGFYQYSTHGSWDNAHYEKLAEVQAEYLRIYSLAYLFDQNPKYKDAALKTVDYLNSFMTDKSGAFYASQDADVVAGEKATDYFKLDDRARRKIGIPPLDTNIYSNKNGLIIEALTHAYKAFDDEKILIRALKAAKAVNASNKSGSAFKHGGNDSSSYLADNLYMAQAFLALYEVTADRSWLSQANETAGYIVANYKADKPGYLSSSIKDLEKNPNLNSILKPEPLLAENIKAARFLNRIHHYTGNKIYKEEAKSIMRYLASEDIVFGSLTEPGILVADYELSEDPVHFAIVGSKKDKQAVALFDVALQYPAAYTRIEWYDKKEGKLLNHDVEYPDLPKPAAFSCVNHACSLPIFDTQELEDSFSDNLS